MTHLTRKDLSFDAGQWPLKSDLPTIIFIHGSGNNRLFWANQLQALTDAANTVAIDLPGHGESPGQGMDQVNDYAQVVEAFIEAIQAPMPIPCGLSLGGAIAIQLLLNRKTKYRAGILINTGARLKVLPEIFNMIKNDYSAYTEASHKMAASPHTDPGRLQAIAAEAKKCPADVVYKDFSACNAFDVMGRLEEIAEPVLVLSAADDLLTPPKYAQFLCKGIPGSKNVHIAQAGHLSPVEQPDAVNQAIREFLKVTAPI
ncbi:MAG: alpha/beta fold hydrolase [Desulfobacterales bacterium]|nr:alpha/beta fold hydrolase [Desulfobacterales bacterium]